MQKSPFSHTQMMRLPARLLLVLGLSITPPVFAVTLSEAIVIDENAAGRTSADERAPEIHRYPKYMRVKVIEEASTPDGVTVFRLEQMIAQHRNPRPPERIPSLWVDASHLVLLEDMKPVANCWPYRQVLFRSGGVPVKIDFNADGSGALIQSEGESTAVPIRTFESRSVIGIRNRKGVYLYTLLSDRDSGELSVADDRVTMERRDCSAAAAK